MLDIARGTVQEAGVADKLALQHGDAALLTNLLPAAPQFMSAE